MAEDPTPRRRERWMDAVYDLGDRGNELWLIVELVVAVALVLTVLAIAFG
jgi:hypothetical protein